MEILIHEKLRGTNRKYDDSGSLRSRRSWLHMFYLGRLLRTPVNNVQPKHISRMLEDPASELDIFDMSV